MVTPTTPAHAIVSSVRAAIDAFPPSPDDTPYDRAKRATAAIAEAGLRLRDALSVFYDVPWCTACGADAAAGVDHEADCPALEFDAAVRAACGEVVE